MITDESGKPVRLVGSCWDVTEPKETIRDLKHARSLLEAAIEATADGLLVVDNTGKVTAYNHRFLSLWRIPPELVEERDDEKLLSFVLDELDDPDGFLRRVHELYDHPDHESFDVIRLKGGRVFERFSTPQRLGNHIAGRVWSFRDVTDREWLYRRAVFLAAYQIPGPATSVHMAVQALLKGQLSAEALSKVVEMTEREDRRLTKFVDELDDLDKIRADRIEFTFEELNLADVVREASSRLGPELARTGSSLSVITGGRPVGQWDRIRLNQVVTNLLSNAIKFGLGKPIEIHIKEQDGISTLVVKDHGIGIPAEMVARIFDPFERRSFGSGLLIVRKLVQGMGGSVRVESRLGAGSTFTVELPGVKVV
jgi:signal transduction histidine kinase